MKSWSLRAKIVIMASAAVAVAGLFLTAISISSANMYMRSIVSYDLNSSEQGAVPSPPLPGGIQEDSLVKQDPVSPPVPAIEGNKISYQAIMDAFAKNALLSMLFTLLFWPPPYTSLQEKY